MSTSDARITPTGGVRSLVFRRAEKMSTSFARITPTGGVRSLALRRAKKCVPTLLASPLLGVFGHWLPGEQKNEYQRCSHHPYWGCLVIGSPKILDVKMDNSF